MASRASKIAVEDSIAEFNKTRHRNSGTTGSESENANGKPKPPKKKPKKAKSVYARSVMTTMTNKVSTCKICKSDVDQRSMQEKMFEPLLLGPKRFRETKKCLDLDEA